MRKITRQIASEFLSAMPSFPKGGHMRTKGPIGTGTHFNETAPFDRDLLQVSPTHPRETGSKPGFLKEIKMKKDITHAGKALGIEIRETGGKTEYNGKEKILAVGYEAALAIAAFAHYYKNELDRNSHLIRQALGSDMPEHSRASVGDVAFSLLFLQLAGGGIKDAFSRLDATPETLQKMERFGWGRQRMLKTNEALLDIQIDFCKKIWRGSEAER